MNLAKQLDVLLGDFSHLAPRIRNLEFDTSECGERIHVGCSYIAFRDGQPTFDDFIETIVSHIISFCLPRSDIRAARTIAASGDNVAAARAMMELSDKARALFIKAKRGSHRSGEGGEILLVVLHRKLTRVLH